MAEIENTRDLEKWLEDKRRAWSVMIATRVALRVLPLLGHDVQLVRYLNNWKSTIAFPIFRAQLISEASGKYSLAELVVVANDAADAADAAHRAASSSNLPESTYAAAYVADAAYTARTSRVAYAAYAAGADVYPDRMPLIWSSISADATALENGQYLSTLPLWLVDIPDWAAESWAALKSELLSNAPHWQVWINWYEDRLIGDAAAARRGRPVIKELEIERALILDHIWKQGAEVVNAEIARIEAKYWRTPLPTVEQVADVASPIPTFENKTLGAAPNPDIDEPTLIGDLYDLPDIQLALIEIIMVTLRGNAPPALVKCFEIYQTQLSVRGIRPILGILEPIYNGILAEYAASDASVWFAPSSQSTFESFKANHRLFIKHFPLVAKRENVLGAIEVDESKSNGKDLLEPFRQALEMAKAAKEAGIATEDVIELARFWKQSAEAIVNLPDNAAEIHLDPADRPRQTPTRKQQLIGGAIGYLERAYNLLGTTVTLAQPNAVTTLVHQIGAILDMLKPMIGL